MAEQRITVKLEGAVEDDGHVRLSEFINQLQSIKAALKQTERSVTGSDEPSLYYKVVDLSHSSPATVIIEPTPINPEINPFIVKTTVKKFFTTLRLIEKRNNAPKDFDITTLEAYRDLGSMLDKHVRGLTIANFRHKVLINEQFKAKVVTIIGPDEIVEGSVSGTLEWINLHNANRFNIYPVIGSKKVVCEFPSKLKNTVKAAIDRHVEVFGELKYKKRDKFPYAMTVTSIEILPEDEDLPSLMDLRGIAPNATGNLTSQEFIRSIRDEGW